MRIAFVNTLLNNAKSNKQIFLITADLGFSVFEEYIAKLPQQFLNAGIAEQNMTGLAAGMAMEGKIPFIYSIVPFSTMRNFEQIRNDICYQNLNVKIVGVGAGFSYGPYGHTHHGLEDVGILRTIPNITIFTPGDPFEAEWAVTKALEIDGPVYIRLGRVGEPRIHKKSLNLKVGKMVEISNYGSKFILFASGTMLQSGMEVVDKLNHEGINGQLVSVPTIKPFDRKFVIDNVSQFKATFALEEHSVNNALGSALAEVLAEEGIGTRLKRIGVPDRFTKVMGNQEYMRAANQLSVAQIMSQVRSSVKKSNSQ